MSLAEVAARLRKEAEGAERQRAAHVRTDPIIAIQYLGYKLGYEQAVAILEADPEFLISKRDAARVENVELRRRLREGWCGKCDYEGGNLVDDLTKERDAIRREVGELRSKYDCGKNPCAWVGGLCLRHAAEYCRYLEQKFSKLRSAIQEAYGYLSDVPSGQPAYEYLARIGAAGQALKGILEGKADP